jgi:hypothetical protein
MRWRSRDDQKDTYPVFPGSDVPSPTSPAPTATDSEFAESMRITLQSQLTYAQCRDWATVITILYCSVRSLRLSHRRHRDCAPSYKPWGFQTIQGTNTLSFYKDFIVRNSTLKSFSGSIKPLYSFQNKLQRREFCKHPLTQSLVTPNMSKWWFDIIYTSSG